jgi:uncharacterized protein
MTSERRWVFDTNVIISALLFDSSLPGRAFFHGLAEGTILLSRPSLQELQEVLGRKKFDRYLTREERDAFLVRLTQAAALIESEMPIRACRDPKDDTILEVAVAGRADAIVTGDEDLLAMNPFQNIPILTPARFLEVHAPPSGPATAATGP